MKTVLLHEYNAKKIIADNLAIITGNSRYKNISDAEFARINNAIDTYNQAAQTEYDGLHDLAQIEQQNSELSLRLEQIESEILGLADNNIIDVQEDGFYFVDEYGRIGAKIINTGFYAINFNDSSNSGGGSGSGSSSSTPSDLTVIDY